MSDLLELSVQYRTSGLKCKEVLKQLQEHLGENTLRQEDVIETRRQITLLTAMTRECLATSNYLKRYHERRKWLEKHRQKSGI